MYYIIQVISKLLDPKTSEHTASFVGRLVSVVIGKVGSQLGENLDLMLRAVLSKMQQAETLTVIQVYKRNETGTFIVANNFDLIFHKEFFCEAELCSLGLL